MEAVFFDFALRVNAPRAIQHGGPAEELDAECEYKPYKWPEQLLKNFIVLQLLRTALLFFVVLFWSFFFLVLSFIQWREETLASLAAVEFMKWYANS